MKLGTYTGPIAHPMGDSPPEPTADATRRDILEHTKRYNNAKADRDGCLETIKECEATMKDAKDYLDSEYNILLD